MHVVWFVLRCTNTANCETIDQISCILAFDICLVVELTKHSKMEWLAVGNGGSRDKPQNDPNLG
jgi:hypothetical protein